MQAKKILNEFENSNAVSEKPQCEKINRQNLLSRLVSALFSKPETHEDFERLEGLKAPRSQDPWNLYRNYWRRF